MEDPFAPGGELCGLVDFHYQMDSGIKIDKKLRIDRSGDVFELEVGDNGRRRFSLTLSLKLSQCHREWRPD